MWMQRISSRERESLSGWFRGDVTTGASEPDRSDFSPVFWLASVPPGRGGRAHPIQKPWATFAGIPLSYPLLIGIALMFLFLLQWNFVSGAESLF